MLEKSVDSPLNIAVIGAGISGITTAYLLQKKHHVTLYEKNDYIGGHTHTIIISDGPDQGTPVDTGFIVLNYKTYPNFIKFLHQLNVTTCPTDMSFSYHSKETGLCYASRNFNALFAQRKNLAKPTYWRFVYNIFRFLRSIRSSYLENRLEDITLGQFFRQKGFRQDVIQQFIIPMAAAIWSGSDIQMKEFPVRTFAQFYENHGLLDVRNHPPWYYVKGGSHTYVKAFLKMFKGDVLMQSKIRGIKRENGNVAIEFGDNGRKIFDAVVIATHADQAIKLLEDPSPDEKRLLGQWRYSNNQTMLHTDASIMPPNRRAWASWNYAREIGSGDDSPITVTYHMNRLQRLNTVKPYFVTLNPKKPIPEEHVIRKIEYTHPQYSFNAFATQKELGKLNGKRNTCFCGSYFGYGFHEDGVNSALAVAREFGIEL